MAQKILANAFSISMLPMEAMNFIRVKKINPNDVPADVESAIGHSDTARVVSNILGFEVKPNRVSIKLSENDVLYSPSTLGRDCRRVQLPCLKEQASSSSRSPSTRKAAVGATDMTLEPARTASLVSG